MASWLQCARRVEELIGAAVPQTRNWEEAALPCQQAVKLAHDNMVGNEGVDAVKVAGTTWETLHLSCRTKLQKAIALNDTAIRRDRWFVQATSANNKLHCRGQRETNAVVQWCRSVDQSRTGLSKNTMLDQPYERAVRLRMGLPLAPPNSTCKVYQRNQSILCGKEITVWADHAHGCAKAARNTGTTISVTCGKESSRTVETESTRNSLSDLL